MFASHRARAFKFILRLTRDEAVAEEVLTEVFFEAWRNAIRFEGHPALATWLIAIARNQALSALARRGSVALDDELLRTSWSLPRMRNP